MKLVAISSLLLVAGANAFVAPSQRQATSALFSTRENHVESRRSVLAGSLATAAAFVPMIASAKEVSIR